MSMAKVMDGTSENTNGEMKREKSENEKKEGKTG